MSIYETSLEKIQEAVENGDLKAAMWYVDRQDRREGIRIEEGLFARMRDMTPERLERMSRDVIRRAVEGKLNSAQVKFIQDAIARHSELMMAREIKQLREDIADMKERGVGGGSGARRLTLNGSTPTWGRLSE